jgi:hypothetical protein
MGASVRIDGDAFSDVRYEILAKACQLADADHARGKMLQLWRHCTQQQTHAVARVIVVAILGDNGPDALETAQLGEVVGDEIRIRGTRGRIEWLAKLRNNAKKGGIKKAAKRQAIGRQLAHEDSAKALPKPCPPFPIPIPTPVPTSKDCADDSHPPPLSTGQSRAARKTPSGEHAAFVAAFDSAYLAASGARPTWGAKQGKLVASLLKAHGFDECNRRMRNMFDSPPPWPPPPHDLATFSQHFDRFASPYHDKRLSIAASANPDDYALPAERESWMVE